MATKKKRILKTKRQLPLLQFGGDPTSLDNLGQSFAQMNNLSPGLASTNNPGGRVGGSGLSFNPLSLGLNALGAIGGAVGANMANRRNELYEDAMEGMRPVDVNQATKGAGIQAFLQNPLTLGIGGKKRAKLEAEEFNENIAKQQRNKDIASRFSTMSEAPTYSPVARQGGFIAYKGETHEGPNDGILVDKMGNPTGVSQEESVGLVEGGGKNKKGEVSYYEPESGSTYIYSDALGFARPANGLLNKYKLNKPESLQYQQYKNDLLTKTMVDKKFTNLRVANEFAKETGSSAKDSIGIFKKGGELSSSKAKEMLRDGTANGKKLTAKQKRYFGWVAGGRKEEGGPLPLYLNGGEEELTPFEQYWLSKNKFTSRYNKLRDFYNNKFEPFLERSGQRLTNMMPSEEFYKSSSVARGPGEVGGTTGSFSPAINYKKYQTLEAINNKRTPEITVGQPIGPKLTSKKPGGSRTPKGTFNPIEAYQAPNDYMEQPSFGSLVSEPGVANMNLPSNPVVAGQGVNPFGNETESMNQPWLNPAGHILSGAGALADYFAMKKAKPENLSLGRVGAERISLAQQRLANTRNAASARAMAGSAARSSGMNAGVALSNTLAANTGANRLLGQQNAELLQNEENANAQMRQQVNMVNAELAAQEGMFNTQQGNAYRMMMAQRNPLGNLARNAASYFADNAAYGQQYDTLQMLAPNAELYRDPNALWKKNPFARPKVRLR